MTASSVSTLDDEAVQDWDQFLLRFTKWQDTLGARVFPAVLECLQEPYEDRPMIDKLRRLEQLGLLLSFDEWQRARAIKNHFAHDYPEDAALKAAFLNEAVETAEMLDEITQHLHPTVQRLI